jgi:hypothetical protein
MRYFTALIIFLLILSPQVHACRSVSASYFIFFKTIPDPPPDADVIAKISILNVKQKNSSAIITVKVMQLLKTSDARIHQGMSIPMKIFFTDCGPERLKNGDEGIIIAQVRVDSKEHLVMLYPYRRRFESSGDNPRFSPPLEHDD